MASMVERCGMQTKMIMQSLKENWEGMALMACSALSVAIGQMLWKFSGGSNITFFVLGFTVYGLGALLMILAFKHGRLSVVHPVQSLSNVFGLMLGYLFLGELLNPYQLLAVVLIMFGLVLVGGGEHE